MKWLFSFLLVLQVGAFGAETLHQKQVRFAQLVPRLITEANRRGYELTLGEAWRSPEQAAFQVKWNAAHGKGIKNSLHTKRLALDINLFLSGRYLTGTSDYEALGIWWEAQCRECRWGGRFRRPDGNHFSIEHEGVR